MSQDQAPEPYEVDPEALLASVEFLEGMARSLDDPDKPALFSKVEIDRAAAWVALSVDNAIAMSVTAGFALGAAAQLVAERVEGAPPGSFLDGVFAMLRGSQTGR